MAKFYKFDFSKELLNLKPSPFLTSSQLMGRSKTYCDLVRKLEKRLTSISCDPKVAIDSKDKKYSDKLQKELSKEIATVHKRYAEALDIMDWWKKSNETFIKAMLVKLKQK